MTWEEAIYRLKNTAWLGSDADRVATEEAVRMAIEALKLASNLHQTCIKLASNLHQTCIKLASLMQRVTG